MSQQSKAELILVESDSGSSYDPDSEFDGEPPFRKIGVGDRDMN